MMFLLSTPRPHTHIHSTTWKTIQNRVRFRGWGFAVYFCFPANKHESGARGSGSCKLISGLNTDNNDDDSHGDNDNLNRETIITARSVAETEQSGGESAQLPANQESKLSVSCLQVLGSKTRFWALQHATIWRPLWLITDSSGIVTYYWTLPDPATETDARDLLPDSTGSSDWLTDFCGWLPYFLSEPETDYRTPETDYRTLCLTSAFDSSVQCGLFGSKDDTGELGRRHDGRRSDG